MRDYPFTILDIAGILNLKVRRRQPTNIDVDCPFCGHKKGKMNLNFAKNVFRCNYCGESGGMIELYSKVFQISNAQAFAEICEILHDNKKRMRCQSRYIRLIWSRCRKRTWKHDIRPIPCCFHS